MGLAIEINDWPLLKMYKYRAIRTLKMAKREVERRNERGAKYLYSNNDINGNSIVMTHKSNFI